MLNIERRNGLNQVQRLEPAGVLFDRGCFMVNPKGTQLFKRSRIESFADLGIFDGIPSERRTKRRMNNWIGARSRRG